MEIAAPIWRLKAPRCVCCDGEGALCFFTCPRCAHLLLICDEVGTVFPDPKELTQAADRAIDDQSYLCPNCGEVAVSDFRHSTSEEIQVSGFLAGEYE